MQHGPLHLFQMYQDHGVALAKYSSKEEAAKAQSTLNNCMVGNMKIVAALPDEAEVSNILQKCLQVTTTAPGTHPQQVLANSSSNSSINNSWSLSGESGQSNSVSTNSSSSTMSNSLMQNMTGNNANYDGNRGIGRNYSHSTSNNYTNTTNISKDHGAFQRDPQQQQQSNSVYRAGNGNSGGSDNSVDSSSAASWNASGLGLWSFNNSGNNPLWSGGGSIDSNAASSSVQNLLPGDLLGEEAKFSC